MGKELNKKSEPQEAKIIKDTPSRSLAKALSWRLIASLTTFLITFVIFRQRLSATYRQVLEASTIVMIFDVVLKILIYYLHERLWTNIAWGKYMQRRYWKRRAWRKLYRKMHDD